MSDQALPPDDDLAVDDEQPADDDVEIAAPIGEDELEPVMDVERLVVLDDGDASLGHAAASAVAAEIGATVVLVAGSHDAGKTTLLVELYAQFLNGPFGEFRFAGSKTLDALDHRHFLSRLDSGNTGPDTERTSESDMRLLHLRLADSEGRHQALMPSDLKGELFEDLADGRGTVDELLPLARRADKTIMLIDGEQIAGAGTRQAAILRARLLIGSLTELGGVRPASPFLIVLSKVDLLDEEQVAWYREELAGLLTLAEGRGLDSVSQLEIAARPRDNSEPIGLAEILGWMWIRVAPEPSATHRSAKAGRVFVTGNIS